MHQLLTVTATIIISDACSVRDGIIRLQLAG